MQKKTIKASILIWAIFISLIITATFIQISTKINKNLRNNNEIISQIGINNWIQNIISSWSLNWIYTDTILSNWDQIIFDKSKLHKKSLKQLETTLLKVISNNNITISIIEWWPIEYKNNTNTWIINNNITFSATIWDLTINNLWWFTKLKIASDSSNTFLSKYTNYKVIKKIWNKEIIKTKWRIKNF